MMTISVPFWNSNVIIYANPSFQEEMKRFLLHFSSEYHGHSQVHLLAVLINNHALFHIDFS